MTSFSPTSVEDEKPGIIFVAVTWEERGRSWVFSFDRKIHRPIVVGAQLHADVCVNAPGVLPTHFYFECEENKVNLVVAYGDDVRVNTVPVRGSLPIFDRALIQFGSVRLKVRVRK